MHNCSSSATDLQELQVCINRKQLTLKEMKNQKFHLNAAEGIAMSWVVAREDAMVSKRCTIEFRPNGRRRFGEPTKVFTFFFEVWSHNQRKHSVWQSPNVSGTKMTRDSLA